MEQQSAVEWLVKELNLEGYDYTIEQAKQMEANNTRYACGYALSKLLYQQAIKESEKNRFDKFSLSSI